MTYSSIQDILWWTFWGLAMGGGIFTLKESFRNSSYFLISMPLLTGSIAAAISRISHEYRKAVVHIKWLAFGTPVALIGLACLYARAGAYGPFAKGGDQK